MVSSPSCKYIFIANPKTGSTTVEHYLREWDPGSLHNRFVDVNGNIVRGIHGHIRPRDLKRMMKDLYKEYKVFIFIRNPYDKAVSGYHYYRQGKRKQIEFGKNKGTVRLVFNLFLARILPFQFWSLIKPVKSNYDYLTDDDGTIIVDYIGTTDKLSSDLTEIARVMGIIEEVNGRVGRTNVSKRDKEYNQYFQKAWHKKAFDYLNKRDIDIYHQISEKPSSFSWRGKKFD